MKKIMFNDQFGLTQAVFDGRKTITRRIIPEKIVNQYETKADWYIAKSRYKVGEVVAIAQSYKDVYKKGGFDMHDPFTFVEESAGYTNKMFVKAELMPHHIKITNIRVEHLCEISNEECIKEGIYKHDPIKYDLHFVAYSYDATEDPHLKKWWFHTPREAFSKLIDKVSGEGTWDSNPLVWVFEFELID